MRKCIANKSLEQWGKFREGEELSDVSDYQCELLVRRGHARWEDDTVAPDIELQRRRPGRPTNAEREARLAAEATRDAVE